MHYIGGLELFRASNFVAAYLIVVDEAFTISL